MPIRITEAAWTKDATDHLWSWIAHNPWLKDSYTLKQVGKGIVNFLRATNKLHGEVLDYGCGSGSLIDYLLDIGVACTGIDASSTAADVIRKRFRDRAGWRGAFLAQGLTLPFSDNHFDVITCIETIEHVRSEDMQPMLKELRRLLKPGGLLLMTAPFQENLDASTNYCPFCDREFHRWQHLRSVRLEDFTHWCESSHLIVEQAWAVDFRAFQEPVVSWPGWRHLSWHLFRHWLDFQLVTWLDQYFPHAFPNGREFRIRLSRGTPSNACILASKYEMLSSI